MDATLTLAEVDAQVQQLADELTPELLPLLLERMLKRDSLIVCERHDKLLFPYVRAQIALTRAKRNYYRYGECEYSPPVSCELTNPSDVPLKSIMCRMKSVRDRIRTEYRGTPCTCWVHHR